MHNVTPVDAWCYQAEALARRIYGQIEQLVVLHRIHMLSGIGVPIDFSRLGQIMSQLSDAIAAATASVDAAISRVTTDVASLNSQIAALQAQVAAGTATPADIQALADLKTKVDALDPTSPVVVPPAPTP